MVNTAPMEHQLLKIKDFAALLGVSVRQIQTLRTQNMMPKPVTIGRSCRWRSDEIGAWIRAGCPSLGDWERHHKARQQLQDQEAINTWRIMLNRARRDGDVERVGHALASLKYFGAAVNEPDAEPEGAESGR